MGISVEVPDPAPGATHTSVYVSSPNGEIPHFVGDYPAAQDVIIEHAYEDGFNGVCRYEAPLPAGHLFFANGRLCSFKNNMLCVGLPYRYGYYQILDGYIPFKEDVQVSVRGGVRRCCT